MSFEIDEATAEAVRQKANQAGKTPEAWIADVIRQQTTLVSTGDGASQGGKFSRKEIYKLM